MIMRYGQEVMVGTVLVGLMLSVPPVRAEGKGPSPDQHLAVFRYDPDSTYTILTLPGVPTDIQLAADEKITGFALGDTIQWVVEELPSHLFIKPMKPDLFTAGTLVTNRRVYQLIFRSTAPQGRWVQKVAWEEAAGKGAVKAAGSGDELPAPETLDRARLNTDYRIEGEGDFRPLSVFDDGRFTWIRMRSPQALPALFMVDEEGTALVNYLIKGDYFVVQRLMPEILLKLGGTEIRIINRKLSHSSGDER